MASDIDGIYDDLAGMSITVGSTSVAAKDLHQLPNAVESPTCPVRLLMPLRDRLNAGGSAANWTMGHAGGEIRWRIRDLMLWRPVGQGIGFKDVCEDLVDYCGLYFDAIRALTFTATNSTALLECDAWMDTLEFPLGSGRWYHGVDVTVTISELIT